MKVIDKRLEAMEAGSRDEQGRSKLRQVESQPVFASELLVMDKAKKKPHKKKSRARARRNLSKTDSSCCTWNKTQSESERERKGRQGLVWLVQKLKGQSGEQAPYKKSLDGNV